MRKLMLCVLMLIFACPVIAADWIKSTDIVADFFTHMRHDHVTFDTVDVYQLTNIAASIVCTHGLAYDETSTVILASGTAMYLLPSLAIWVYGVESLNRNEAPWKSYRLKDHGRFGTGQVDAPKFYDFMNTFYEFDAESTYLHVYPTPSEVDTILVHYWAWADTVNANIDNEYYDALLKTTLSLGYLRKSQSDKALLKWNEASSELSLLRNFKLGRIYDIEVIRQEVSD